MQTPLSFAADPRLPALLDRLKPFLGSAGKRGMSPLEQLIFGVVSEGLAPAAGLAIYNRLRTAYPQWSLLRDADPAALAPYFIGVPSAAQRAAALPAILKAVDEVRGALDLGFLRGMEAETAKGWLRRLPGVSRGVADAVLAFSDLAVPAAALDHHGMRAARRLGLCGKDTPASAVNRQVTEKTPAGWSASQIADFSQGLSRLGASICVAPAPQCHRCPAASLCPLADRPKATVLSFPASGRNAVAVEEGAEMRGNPVDKVG